MKIDDHSRGALNAFNPFVIPSIREPGGSSKMKYKIIVCAVMIAVGIVARSEEPAVKQQEFVRFDGKTFALAWEGKNPAESANPDEIVKEYLLDGEKLESWTKLASTREYPKVKDPMVIASKLLETLKKQSPQAPNRLTKNQETGEVMLDYMSAAPDNSFVEFDIYRCRARAGGGVVAQEYALRAYKDIATFIKGLAPERVRLLQTMATTGLQQGK